jgi:hypothetical protein
MSGRGRWSESVAALNRLFAELLAEGADREKILKAAQILGILQEIHVSERGPQRIRRPSIRPPAEDGPSAAKHFAVEQIRDQEYLAEYRASGQQPFRCPQKLYELVAEEMAKVVKPVSFEDLLQAIRTRAKQQVAEYLPRMCLRFWLDQMPPLVEKQHARYRPVHSPNFPRDVKRRWRELAEARREG